jgi:MoxR-like ATPase
MVCPGKCSHWQNFPRRSPTGERYGDGQIRCNTCAKWLFGHVMENFPGFEIHTHDSNQQPNADPTAGIYCDCCGYKIRGRPRAAANSSYPISYTSRLQNLTDNTTPKTFNDLEKFLVDEIKPQANYQFVILKTLLENDGECSFEKIKEEISFYNPDITPDPYIGIEVLNKHEFINSRDNSIVLNIADLPDYKKILSIIVKCNQYIYKDLDYSVQDHFIAVGDWSSWENTITNLPLRWAVKPSDHAVYDISKSKNLVYIYANSAGSNKSIFSEYGFFGLCIIKNKFQNEEPYWESEHKSQTVSYKNSFYLDPVIIGFDDKNILEMLNNTPQLPIVKGLNRIANDENKNELLANATVKWDLKFPSQKQIVSRSLIQKISKHATPDTEHYLLLKHNPDGAQAYARQQNQQPWVDDLGKIYHYKQSHPNGTILKEGKCATIWYYHDSQTLYLWGNGFVNSKAIPDPNDDSKLISELERFAYFDKNYTSASSNPPTPLQVPSEIFEKIKNYEVIDPATQVPTKKWNVQNSIIEINEELFDELLSIPDSTTNLSNTFEDSTLIAPEESDLKTAITQIQNDLLIDEKTIYQIVSSLVSGKNILLTGGVGTGKTHLAQILPKTVWKENIPYHTEVYTATSDWTEQDVIGGIFPKIKDNGDITYEINLGCVSQTVAENWYGDNSDQNKRVFKTIDKKKIRGTWLVIDEFNRANIDKSFGQLFTAIEYGTLKIPTSEAGKPFKELKIPEDYRIIGTLNTSDRHFLNTLSDALKRRFAIIEMNPPTYDQKDLEIFYVVKNSLRIFDSLPTTKQDDYFVLDENSKSIEFKDNDVELCLKQLHHILSFIRNIKPLGLALFQSMFRYIIVNNSMGTSWDECLDQALINNILPQIETQPFWTLKIMRSVICNNDLFNFFKTTEYQKSSSNYVMDIEKICKFLNSTGKKPKKLQNRLLTNQPLIDNQNAQQGTSDEQILDVWDESSLPKLPQFREALTKLIYEQGGEYETSNIEEQSNSINENDQS